jgi:four helix bundle protein
MMAYAYPVLRNFPKAERYAMVADIKQCMDDLLELIVAAQKKYYKKTTLQELDVANTKLKYYIRLANTLGLLPNKQYENWSKMVVEIGKIIGGWINSAKH